MKKTNLDKLINEIDVIKAKLDAAPAFTEGELKRLREHFMVDFTYNSNAIEGNTLTLHETALVVLEGLTISKKPLKDHLEAVGHKEAFNYVIDISKNNQELSERIIKDIHALVLMDSPSDRGKYRDLLVRISGYEYIPPHPIEVPARMKNLLDEYKNDKRHPIIKISDLHVKFERIHPFIDGNGRTGRLALNLELIKAGYAPINVKFKDREAYIDCFKDYEKKGTSDKFIEMVAKYELEELKTIENLVKEKQVTQEYHKKQEKDKRSSISNKKPSKPKKETPNDLIARMTQKSTETKTQKELPNKNKNIDFDGR